MAKERETFRDQQRVSPEMIDPIVLPEIIALVLNAVVDGLETIKTVYRNLKGKRE